MEYFQNVITESMRTNIVDPSNPCIVALIHAVEAILRTLSRENHELPEGLNEFMTSGSEQKKVNQLPKVI